MAAIEEYDTGDGWRENEEEEEEDDEEEGCATWCCSGASGDLDICFGEDADDSGGDFVVDDGFVVFAYDVGSEFLFVKFIV